MVLRVPNRYIVWVWGLSFGRGKGCWSWGRGSERFLSLSTFMESQVWILSRRIVWEECTRDCERENW